MTGKTPPEKQELEYEQIHFPVTSIPAVFTPSSDITADACVIIESCQRSAYQAINIALVIFFEKSPFTNIMNWQVSSSHLI